MNSSDLPINARLADEGARRLHELQQREGLRRPQLLRNALRECDDARYRPREAARTMGDLLTFRAVKMPEVS